MTPHAPDDNAASSEPDTSEHSETEVQRIEAEVDRLCSEYSTADALQLLTESRSTLDELSTTLDGAWSGDHHRRLREQVGWLHLLNAALSYDLGQADDAEEARQQALQVGEQIQSPSILGWAHETGVWIEISNANWQAAIDKADKALQITGDNEPTGVAIQLALEKAEAHARLGEAPGFDAALADARRRLTQHPPPANPRNHFRFDHDKFDVREMRALLVLEEDDRAEQVALRLQRSLPDANGNSQHPMRTSEVLASLALVEARRGNVGTSVELLTEALAIGRQSRLSFHQITSAVADELRKHESKPEVQRVLSYRDQLLVG